MSLEKDYEILMKRYVSLGDAVRDLESVVKFLREENDSVKRRNDSLLRTMKVKDDIIQAELNKSNEEKQQLEKEIGKLKKRIKRLSDD